jgi:SNF2 family DNA or RNA helicase
VVNPAAYAQAIDQKSAPHRADKAVFAYRLIARDTVEERIAEPVG